jgi:hypothetical protein
MHSESLLRPRSSFARTLVTAPSTTCGGEFTIPVLSKLLGVVSSASYCTNSQPRLADHHVPKLCRDDHLPAQSAGSSPRIEKYDVATSGFWYDRRSPSYNLRQLSICTKHTRMHIHHYCGPSIVPSPNIFFCPSTTLSSCLLSSRNPFRLVALLVSLPYRLSLRSNPSLLEDN